MPQPSGTSCSRRCPIGRTQTRPVAVETRVAGTHAISYARQQPGSDGALGDKHLEGPRSARSISYYRSSQHAYRVPLAVTGTHHQDQVQGIGAPVDRRIIDALAHHAPETAEDIEYMDMFSTVDH